VKLSQPLHGSQVLVIFFSCVMSDCVVFRMVGLAIGQCRNRLRLDMRKCSTRYLQNQRVFVRPKGFLLINDLKSAYVITQQKERERELEEDIKSKERTL